MSKRSFPTTGAVTKAELNEKSLKDLIEMHNALAEKPVKAFRDKPSALERVWAMGAPEAAAPAPAKADRKAAIAAAASAKAPKAPKEPKAKAVKAPKAPKEPKAEGAGRSRKTVDLPASAEQKPPRAGTAVEVAMTLWGRPGGATDEEVCAATGKQRGHVRGILRWCNRGLGYGFKQEGDKIFLVSEKGRATTYTAQAKAA